MVRLTGLIPVAAVSLAVAALRASAGPTLHTLGGHAAGVVSVAGAALTEPASRVTQAAATPDRPAAAADRDEATQAPVGRFLGAVKAAIPWVVGLFLVGALAVVVATCWLRKGVLTQHLASGGGSTGAGKPAVNPKGAAEYLARLKQRQAARRTAEATPEAAAKDPPPRPPARRPEAPPGR